MRLYLVKWCCLYSVLVAGIMLLLAQIMPKLSTNHKPSNSKPPNQLHTQIKSSYVDLSSASSFDLSTETEAEILGIHVSDLLHVQQHRMLVSNINGSILQRIQYYNTVLNEIRKHLMRSSGNSSVNVQTKQVKQIISADENDFHVRMNSLPYAVGLYLPGKGDVRSDLLLSEYEPGTRDPTLCRIIKAGVPLPQFRANSSCWSSVHRVLQPSDDITRYIQHQLLPPQVCVREKMSGTGPLTHYTPCVQRSENSDPGTAHSSTTLPYLQYVHILRDAVVTEIGNVVTDGALIKPIQCHDDMDPPLTSCGRKCPHHREVFVISQFWGCGFFHKVTENYPRLAAHLGFLLANPDIIIHVSETGHYTKGTLAEAFGISSERLVSGAVRARWVYLPQGVPCGDAPALLLQLSARLYQSPQLHHSRSSIILIHRTRRRKLKQHSAVAVGLKRLAADFGLDYITFTDASYMTYTEAVTLFRKASLIVGPHGAGLTNMIYASPGTAVVETVCQPAQLNLCYQTLALRLGLRYHNVMHVSRGSIGCPKEINAPADQILKAARELLQSR